jgi:hypothetical protein
MTDPTPPAATPRQAIPRPQLPVGTALIGEVSSILGLGIARVIEASAAIESERALASTPCMELAINRGSRLTVQPGDRQRGDRNQGDCT